MNLKGPVSVSRLQRFEGCPWSYYKKYELKADDPVGEMAELGKLQHGIIAEAISQNCAATSEAFDSLMVDVAAGELSYSKDEAKELAQLWSKYSPHYEKIKAVTIKALNLWREKTKGEVVLEKHFIKPLPCGVSLQGYIDFLIPNKVIWDWKTGHN